MFRIELFPGAPQERAAEIENYFGAGQFGLDCALVAEIDERLVGLAELSVRPWAEGCSTSQVGYLEGWYVAPDYRRSGVGRELLAASERWARDRGCREFASDATSDNQVSRDVHLACGFREVGLIRCFHKALGPSTRLG